MFDNFLMIRRPPRSTRKESSAASDVYKRQQIDEKNYRFFVGYSGWSPGQLLEELNAKSWIVYQNKDENLIFDFSSQDLWKKVLREMGGKYRVISNYPVDPRLN